MKKLAAIVCGVVVGLCLAPIPIHADEAKDNGKTGASQGESQPVAVASETGAWSKEVNGVQGRLIVSQEFVLNETQMLAVYLELRNVADVLNPLEIYYTGSNTKGTVTKSGKTVPTAGLPASILSPSPYWLVLPHDSSLRFRISVSGYGVPKNAGALLGLHSGAWLLAPDTNAPYFLQATFNAVGKKESGDRRQWRGTLQLPPVKIPLAPSSNRGATTVAPQSGR